MIDKGNVIVVAGHPDDEVLGCGGMIASLANFGRKVHVLFLADGESSREGSMHSEVLQEAIELRNKAANDACRLLGCSSVEFLSLPDNRLDGVVLLDLVREIEARIERYNPSLILTHHRGDLNVDHQAAHEAVVVACRPVPHHPVRELLFFEIPSSTEWGTPTSSEPFVPNYFVDISSVLQKKKDAISLYAHELREYPHPRSIKAVESLACWRGAMVGVSAAEAFVLGRKIMCFEEK